MRDFNDYLNEKRKLLDKETIEKIIYYNSNINLIFKDKKFEIDTVLNLDEKNELLNFIANGVKNFKILLRSSFQNPNYKGTINGYDEALPNVYFYDLYKKEYDILNNELSEIQIKEFRKDVFRNSDINDLFNYLIENYYNLNKGKYSQIFRYIDSLNGFICSQSYFIKFIQETYNVSISKILDENYNDNLLLKERHQEFDKLN